MSNHDVIETARQAQVVLGNKAFTDACDRYRAKVVREFEKCAPHDDDMRRTLQRHLTTLNVVLKNLQIMIDDGRDAEIKLDFERQTAAQRAKNALRSAMNA